MDQVSQAANRDRVKSAGIVAVIHALLGYALIVGMGFDVAPTASEQLKTFDVLPEPPPPPAPVVEPPKPKTEKTAPKAEKPEGAASPKNLKDTPSPIVALPPVIKLDVPSPVVAAPVAADGNRASAGASDVPGPGTGSGGIGTGLGSGLSGDGTGGGGGGGGVATRARLISGRIRDSDDPRSLDEERGSESVSFRVVVAPSGRVAECTVTRSSGDPVLDRTTCRLFQRRFRYRPARDRDGRAVADIASGTHVWERGPEPPPIDVEPTIPD